jgi:pentatricopeptide repeat protein
MNYWRQLASEAPVMTISSLWSLQLKISLIYFISHLPTNLSNSPNNAMLEFSLLVSLNTPFWPQNSSLHALYMVSQLVFNSLQIKSVYLWTSLINGCVKNHVYNEAFAWFYQVAVVFCLMIIHLQRCQRFLVRLVT